MKIPTGIKLDRDQIWYIFFAMIAWTYIWLRAVYCPFVHDEATTFFIYVRTGNFIPPHAYLDANNHLLNSLLSWLSYKAFGNTELALRLPNILIAPVYFIFMYRIAGFLQNRINRWAFLLTSIFTSFIIEYFAYSRGYGLSMALLAGSVFYLFRFSQTLKARETGLFLLFMTFAVLANMSLINTYILSLLLIVLLIWMNYKKMGRKDILINALLLVLLALPVLAALSAYAFRLRAGGALYYGSPVNSWETMLQTLSVVLFQPLPLLFNYLLPITVFTILVLAAVVFLLSLRKQQLAIPQLLIPFLLFGNLAATILLHVFLGVNFPEDRVAMYFIPMIIGSAAFLADFEAWRRKSARLLLFVPFLLILASSFLFADLTFTSYTNGYRIPEKLKRYIAESSHDMYFRPSIGVYDTHRLEWLYSNLRYHYDLPVIISDNYPSTVTDYLITRNKEVAYWRFYYSLGLYDPKSGFYVLKRKTEPIREKIAETEMVIDHWNNQDVFLNLLKVKPDTLIGKSIRVELTFNISSRATPFDASFYAIAAGENHKMLSGSYIDLDNIKTDWSAKPNKEYRYTLLIPKVPKETYDIMVYLMNKEKREVDTANIRVRMSSFKSISLTPRY